MSSAVWFYALDDVERGPVTLVQLRGLIAAGKLGPEDLVWTEGMADWKPLAAVPGLQKKEAASPTTKFRTAAEDSASTSASGRPASGSKRSPVATRTPQNSPAEPTAPVPPPAPPFPTATTPFPAAGTPAAIGSSTASFRVSPPAASLPASGTADLSAIPAPLQAPVSAPPTTRLDSSPEPLATGTAPKQSATAGATRGVPPLAHRLLLAVGLLLVFTAQGCQLLGSHHAQRSIALHELAASPGQIGAEPAPGPGPDAQVAARRTAAARNAVAHQQAWSYWRALLLVGGTLVLGVGLLLGAWTSEGAERWACWLMLAVLLYCVLGGGSNWQAPPALP